jgi:ribose-phosphate pyrophosphokinase
MGSGKKYDYGELALITLSSCKELGESLDKKIIDRRRRNLDFEHLKDDEIPDTYQIDIDEIRFSNGEGKIKINETVRSKDIYILCDTGNYSCTYNMFGFENHMGPDEHFQDLKRTLSAIGGKASRITVIMPMLYSSRQHKRNGRESLDCAMALKEIEKMGVKDIITFDVHDTSIQNAIPLASFESLYPTYEFVKALARDYEDIFVNSKNLMLISPDTGAMDRAIYYAGVIGVDVGLFYKRRDYSKIVNGKNPIVEHEYMGSDVEGKNVLIVDDMIASGESVIDIVKQLKKRKANKIFIATTFALFTEGADQFEQCYKEGTIERVYSANLSYVPPKVKNSEWFREVDMSKYLAKLVDHLNYGMSVAPILSATNLISSLFQKEKEF